MIRDDFEQTVRHARVPTPEIVWWRAQMRARQEAARQEARPILLSQALAVAALIGLLVSVIGRMTLPMMSWGDLPAVVMGLPVVQIAIAAAFCLVAAPVAVYFALSRE
jgi:hypothetical protein